MFEEDKTIQSQLFAFSHRDLIPSDSDVWLYIDLFENLDLKAFKDIYSSQGQVAKDPQLMLRTLFYGLTHGIVSGRKLEQMCRFDNRFIVLSGDTMPDRRTIDRFLRRHEAQIREFFVQVVRFAQKMGLVKLGRVAIDGTKLKGHTSQWRTMKYEKMQRAIEHIEANLETLKAALKKENQDDITEVDDALPKQIRKQEERIAKIKKAKEMIEKENEERKVKKNDGAPLPKTTKSLNDAEAQRFARRGAAPMIGYNMQAAVDEENQIIVAQSVHPSSTDYGALPELLDQTKKNCGDSAKEVLADLGYHSLENLAEIERHGSLPTIAIGKEIANFHEKVEPQFIEQISLEPTTNIYRCMNGLNLKTYTTPSTSRVTLTIDAAACASCSFIKNCRGFGKKTVTIMPKEDRQRYTKLLERSRTEEFRESYAMRKAIVEPVFGNLKSNKGLKLFRVGRVRTEVWWALACTALNIEKIISRIQLSSRPGFTFLLAAA